SLGAIDKITISVPIVNNGTISFDAAGRIITFNFTNSGQILNSGALVATNSTILNFPRSSIWGGDLIVQNGAVFSSPTMGLENPEGNNLHIMRNTGYIALSGLISGTFDPPPEGSLYPRDMGAMSFGRLDFGSNTTYIGMLITSSSGPLSVFK